MAYSHKPQLETNLKDNTGKLEIAHSLPMMLAYMQIALAMIIIGINVPASKVILTDIPPLIFFLLRAVLASALLLPFAIAKRNLHLKLDIHSFRPLLGLSISGIVLFSLLVLFGMQHTTALSAGIITSSLPAAVALLSFIFLKEHISKRIMACITLAIFGVLVLNFQAAGMQSIGSLFGNMLIILAVFAEAIYTILAKKNALHLSPLKVAIWVNWIALALVTPISLYPALNFSFEQVSIQTWLLLGWVSFSSSILSFFLWYNAIAKVNASIAGLFTALIPLASTFVAIGILGEASSIWHLISMTSIIAAILISTHKNGIDKPPEKSPKKSD